MKLFIASLLLLASTVCTAQTSTSDVWLNEFHYDHLTTRGNSDTAEFIELAMKSTIASNPVELAKYKVILYTGGALDETALLLGRGLPYNVSSSWYSEAETVHALTEFQQCPVANSTITLLFKKLPILQDVPAAIAIIYNNTNVVQLLSYEKAFKIESAARGGGPAAGMMTDLITTQLGLPAMETARTSPNHSISLLGTGMSYSDFFWTDDPLVMATPCERNSNTLTTQDFSGTLPVRWLSFGARGQKQTIFTEWKVATETGVSKYVVELADVNSSFSTTVEVPFSSSANGNYKAAIPNLKNGSYRVRVKSMMMDGKVEFSETRLVRLSDNAGQFVSVFPNPVKGGAATVTIIPTEKTSYTIEIVDMNGKRVSSLKTAVFNANTLNRIEVPVNVAPGVYQLKVVSQHEQQTIKIVVM
ncbi:T9SS type A sorting domain-containing protein [Aridibaculum aurantiacum]|uniref:T9SS type A sorting domain-containing protein n=1 Tax=Aridibaculum aurantiacum TaxID=2810307 RepID=UPI001A957F48|nr:T9SS type A sorting domain-containing protein [Aridibaculum aurantiacum]